MTDDAHIRHSKAENAEVVKDDIEVAKLEASNGVKQTERVRQLVLEVIDGRPFRLRPSTLLDLNRCAIEGLSSYAGVWRPAGIEIGASKHTPPESCLVPVLAEELCDYINDNFNEKSAIHLASVIMWRLNWIHPFTDGNGRTSRASAYFVMCAKEGTLFPGTDTIPEQIVANRDPYYEALECADQAYKEEGQISDSTVVKMEELLSAMLAKQLKSAFDHATT